VDIVQGLPKIEELLEARKVKDSCVLATSDGWASVNNGTIKIRNIETNKVQLIKIPQDSQITFHNGTFVNFLDPLTKGPISPHHKLEILFNYYFLKLDNSVPEACKQSFKRIQLYLVNEVQRTYMAQGVQISDKHIEIIIKQMTSKVYVTNGNATTLLPGEILELTQAELLTKAALASGLTPPIYKPLLLGLTKASLNSNSFLSAASFQETTRILTDAAIVGKKDWLHGLKENVIIGRLIPAGTGFNKVKDLKKKNNNKLVNCLIPKSLTSKAKNSVLERRTSAQD
jgi:DNA-directed RNA polymerase subunit beta'